MTDSAEHPYRRAWWSLALFPASFLAAFAVGEGLFAAIDDGVGDAPLLTILAAGIPALAVFALPVFVTAHFTRLATLAGHPRARRPQHVAIALAGGFVALNLLSLIVTLVGR